MCGIGSGPCREGLNVWVPSVAWLGGDDFDGGGYGVLLGELGESFVDEGVGEGWGGVEGGGDAGRSVTVEGVGGVGAVGPSWRGGGRGRGG